MLSRIAIAFAIVLPAIGADWNPNLAAQYLDSRQKEWSAWPRAKANGGTCVSCHTGVAYLIARPAIRRALGEKEPTVYEKELVSGLRVRLAANDGKMPAPSPSIGVESVLAALILGRQDAAGDMSAQTERAFDRMWSLQIREGKLEGAWPWYSLNQDPWEGDDSAFFGASLAALAAGSTPAAYRERPEICERMRLLAGYLRREQASQPLQNRLALLWASTKFPDALPEPARRKLIEETFGKQQPDGAWTIESLGPWKKHPEAPPANGGNSYATAFTAFVLQQAGITRTNPALARALDWLRSHQDRDGYWTAESLNRRYEPGSMPLLFMRDAATAYASLALLEGAPAGGSASQN